MIPSLIEQVIAARLPTKSEITVSLKRQERKRRIVEVVRRIGNATTDQVSVATGHSTSSTRELLKELVADGDLVTWKGHQNAARVWNIAP